MVKPQSLQLVLLDAGLAGGLVAYPVFHRSNGADGGASLAHPVHDGGVDALDLLFQLAAPLVQRLLLLPELQALLQPQGACRGQGDLRQGGVGLALVAPDALQHQVSGFGVGRLHIGNYKVLPEMGQFQNGHLLFLQVPADLPHEEIPLGIAEQAGKGAEIQVGH